MWAKKADKHELFFFLSEKNRKLLKQTVLLEQLNNKIDPEFK